MTEYQKYFVFEHLHNQIHGEIDYFISKIPGIQKVFYFKKQFICLMNFLLQNILKMW